MTGPVTERRQSNYLTYTTRLELRNLCEQIECIVKSCNPSYQVQLAIKKNRNNSISKSANLGSLVKLLPAAGRFTKVAKNRG